MAIYGTSEYGESVYGSGAVHPYVGVTNKILWFIQVDWDRDGFFGVDIEPQTIKKVKFSAGRKTRISTNGRGQEQPEQETFWFEIDDGDGRYDSFNSSSPLYPYLGASGQTIRLLAYSTTTSNLQSIFHGMLANVTYDNKREVATFIGEGLARWLQIGAAENLYTPCNGLGYDGFPYEPYFVPDGSTPYPVNWWAGRPDRTYLRECISLVLRQCSWPFGMANGVTDFNVDYPDYFYLSDESAWNSIKELADGFAARLFFRRDGLLFALDRQDTTGLTASETPIAGALEAYGLERPNPYAALRNFVEVQVRPHSVRPFNNPDIEADYIKIWSNPGPIAVPPGGMSMDIEFQNDGRPVQGAFLTVDDTGGIVDNIPWQAWSNADRTGTNLKTAATAGVQQALSDIYYNNNQQRGKVIFNNSTLATAYVFDVNVYIIGIVESGQTGLSTKSSSTSIAQNSKRKLLINSRWIQTPAMGDAIAQSYVNALSSRQRASPVTLAYLLDGEDLFQALITHDLGSFVDFGVPGGATALTNFGISGRWLIVARSLEWINGDGQAAILKLTFENQKIGPPIAVSGSVTTVTDNNASNPLPCVHTVPAGDNRLLIWQQGMRAFDSITSITYGDQSFTKAGAVQYAAGNYARVEIWYLVAPVVGTNTINVNMTGVEQIQAAAINFINVDQNNPVSSFVSNTGLGGSSASVVVLAEQGDLVIDVLTKEGGTLSANGSQTSLWTASVDGNWKGGGSSKPGAASVTMSWALTGSNAWALGAVVIVGI